MLHPNFKILAGLVFVTEQIGLSVTWSQNLKTESDFLTTRLDYQLNGDVDVFPNFSCSRKL